MSYIVDLNSDIGEGFGAYTMGLDEEIIKHVTSINVACGWHAGDPLIMDKTAENAKRENVGLGAHPSYPDLLGFGRRKMDITQEEARAYMLYQLGALSAFAKANDMKIQHMKLHGAFYNNASGDDKLADGVIKGIMDYDKDIIILALSGSGFAKRAKEMGARVAEEVFADRAYNEDGTLVNRRLPGAVIHDEEEAIRRIKQMVFDKEITAITGKVIPIKADSICVHGDNPEAVNFVAKIRETLEKEGVEIKALREFI